MSHPSGQSSNLRSGMLSSVLWLALTSAAHAGCPHVDGHYRDRADGSTLTIYIQNCATMTVDHSKGGKFTLPIDGAFHDFRPPRPNAEDEVRNYQARLRAFGDMFVSEFEVRRDGTFIWREVTRYVLDSKGNLLAEDKFFSGEPPHIEKSMRHVFERQ